MKAIGSGVVPILDDAAVLSVKGFDLARVFALWPITEEVAYIRDFKMPITVYGDILPFPGEPLEKELARLLVRERPDVVLLINWHLPLSPFFFEAMSVPVDLCEPTSCPVLLRLTVTHAPTVILPRSQEEANTCQVAAIATRIHGFGQAESTINVFQSPPVDISVGSKFGRTMYSAQRRMARAIVGAWA